MKKTLIAAALAAFLPAAYAADTITIALAGPTTGPVTQYGTIQNLGAQMAIEQINAKGGLNGKQLVAKIYDDACEPKQAVTVANQIVNDGVKFVIGHLCSSSTIPAAKIYNDEGILMITPASTSPELTEKGYTTIFRTIGLDSQTAPISAEYVLQELKPKNVAILHDKQQYGQGLAEGVNKALNDAGVKPVIFEGVNKGQTDFSALITKMKSANVDFIYFGGYHPEAGLILRQGAQQGFKPAFMGADGLDNPDLVAIAGEAAEGVLITAPVDFSKVADNAELVKAFADKGETNIGPFVMPAYSAVQAIVDTGNKLGSDDAEAIAAELHKGESLKTPIGDIAFDDKGDLKSFRFVVYALDKDGNKAQIFPKP